MNMTLYMKWSLVLFRGPNFPQFKRLAWSFWLEMSSWDILGLEYLVKGFGWECLVEEQVFGNVKLSLNWWLVLSPARLWLPANLPLTIDFASSH